MVLLIDVFADEDFIETYGMELTEGRFYSSERLTDASSAIVINETACKTFGFEAPIGKMISWTNPDPEGQDVNFTIIGIVKDFHFESLHQKIKPLNIQFTSKVQSIISVRITADNIHDTIDFIQGKWQQILPEQPFDYTFFDNDYYNLYAAEKKTGKILSVFSILAILIACLGLYGLVSFTAEQRTKEIGIRKTLGASVSGIFLLLSKEFLRWILLSNIIAWPLAYFIMNKWLQNFAYKIDIELWFFFLSAVFTIGVALATVSYHTIKAALTNPIDSLKYE
jgi:putative ABC transport system permease protein